MADCNMNATMNGGDVEVEERIVMTPTKKTQKSTTIRMERVKQLQVDNNSMMHVAGGDHKGIVINKDAGGSVDDASPPHLFLEFKVFLINHQTSSHIQERRQLRFWFKPGIEDSEQMRTAQDFFKELVSPMEFPRDYVGFIKKIMKLMQVRYPQLRQVEVELSQLEDVEKIPIRPMSLDDTLLGTKVEVTASKVLEMIESAYPNPLTLADMAKQTGSTEEEIHVHVTDLEAKGIIRTVGGGSGGAKTYVRVVQNEQEVKVVRQMPSVVSSQQPTIAIITSQYCEKLAVDSMIENKDTYVRYTTVGESNVYTLGTIGAHRVVATKLPTIGHSRAAMIATGNSTTRLLGCFQKVDYVFLVGVGGGVPHYTDYSRHVRLGDIVVSAPPSGKNYIYAYCEQAKRHENGSCSFETKTWQPQSLQLQEIAKSVVDESVDGIAYNTLQEYIEDGMKNLEDQEANFFRPSSETDRLYMSLGGKDVIEVAHPVAPDSCNVFRKDGLPRVHFGAIGSGRHIVRDDSMRQEFADKYDIIAMDHEFDAVVDSIFGNRKDCYMFIRGIADYRDGTRRKEWQPHSALLAAAFMKAVISAMPPPNFD